MPDPRLDLLDEPALEGVRVWGRVLSSRHRNDPEAVVGLQRALARVGLDLAADGHFGSRTTRALRSFQAWAGLDVDGLFGSRSLFALADALSRGVRIPRSTPAPLPLPRGLYGSDPSPGVVALTFDDGPHPSTTPRILDLLRDRALPATFFMLGSRVRAGGELLRRVVDEGHRIGNHTATHPQLGRLSPEQIDAELDAVQRAVDEALGRAEDDPYPMHVRPPYGDPFFSGDIARRKRVGEAIERRGAACILWHVDTRDWAHVGDPEAVVAETRRGLKRTRGGVILLHDVHKQTVDALPGLLDLLQADGYRVAPLDELLARKEAVA